MSTTPSTWTVETRTGAVTGRVVNGVGRALGIPYAAPITPDTRFLPAHPPAPWSEPLDATSVGPIAEQHGVDRSIEMAESCHRVHVWAPVAGRPRKPVIVWLHGGGWYRGEPVGPSTDGANLAGAADVVVVSVTHRLGLLGCLYLADHLGDAYATSGTAVIDDLLLALEWIRDNIAAFGGDPDNVTIVGCSGGGAKTAALFTIPAARTLVSRAIVQSGSAEHYLDRDEGVHLTDRVLRLLEIPRERADRLLTLPAETFSRVQDELFRISPWTPILGTATGLLPFPTVNGHTVPDLPGRLMDPADTRPLIIGSAWEEAILPLARWPQTEPATDDDVATLVHPNLGGATRELVATYRARFPDVSSRELLIRLGSDVESFRAHRLARTRTGGGATRLYRLDWGSTAYDGVRRACHCLEVGLVFRNYDKDPKLIGQAGAREVSEAFSAAVVAFAEGADDVRVGDVAWGLFTADTPQGMVVSTEPRMDPDLHAEAVAVWEPYTALIRR